MVTQLGGSGDTLNRLESMVEEERYKAAGRVRVAVDSLDMTTERRAHQRSRAERAGEDALAQFEAKHAPANLSSGKTEVPFAQTVRSTELDRRR